MSVIDPMHKNLHRVLLVELERYKAGLVPYVVAICGKTWSPTFPVDRMRKRPNCPICFPQDIYKHAIAS